MSTPQVTERIPEHLQPYIARQDASLYTPIDHASWRYILRVSKAFFAKSAHQKYLDGLKETGISTERIPLVEEMDQKLRRFGWRAVPVSGFIPPAVFMEFQSLGILPIACEMRTLEHLAYTPAPDIVHEAAGHAPIIADPEYARYLRNYGEVSRKAIFSKQDMELYEAIRTLSEVKEDPASTPEQIAECQTRFEETAAGITYISEAAYLARMNWWTVEYGLVGSMDNPKIYGAGLLSSVGESYNCLGPNVKKVPLSLQCIEVPYDITRPQPQLFVTPDFPALTQVLEEFAETMAFRQGGIAALKKGQQAQTTTTTELDSGIQISGTLAEVVATKLDEPAYLRFSGPTQLAYQDIELEGQGVSQHPDGYGMALGRLKDFGKSPAQLSRQDLDSFGFAGKKTGKMEFESGVVVEGVLSGVTHKNGKNLILTFKDCRVTLGSQVLFLPDWGVYDLACGERVMSVYGGAADRARYIAATGGFRQKPSKPKSNLTAENLALNELYKKVREIREANAGQAAAKELEKVFTAMDQNHPDDWLLRLELLELDGTWNLGVPWAKTVRERLNLISETAQDKKEMIKRGLELL